jgi:hypothetical protein
MQHPLVRLITFLLAPLASLQAADVLGPVTNRPLVGVIRWDGYNGHPVVTKKQEMGFLKPEKWHSRAPWFFRKTGDSEHPLEFNPSYDKDIIRKITDEEIEYAASAGVDYWAFCYYAKYKGGWGLRDNFEAYLTSPLRSRIKSSIILLGEHVGKGLSSAASAAPDAAKRDWENLVNEIAPLLCDPSYQKVCGGRGRSLHCRHECRRDLVGDVCGSGGPQCGFRLPRSVRQHAGGNAVRAVVGSNL